MEPPPQKVYISKTILLLQLWGADDVCNMGHWGSYSFWWETMPNVSVYKGGLLSLLPLRTSICSCPGHDRMQSDYYNKSLQKKGHRAVRFFMATNPLSKADQHIETKDQMCSKRKDGTVNLSIWKTETHLKSMK